MKNLKVSSLFHWLYGAVMFLPIFLLPVFMIYSHRHTIDSGTLEVPQQEVIDFNQQANIPDFERQNYKGLDIICSDNKFDITGTTEELYYVDLYDLHPFDGFVVGHQYYFKAGNGGFFTVTDPYGEPYNSIWTCESSGFLYYRLNVSTVKTFDHFQLYFQYFDLTQMFGAGNEPTVQEFNQYFPNSYYEYTLSRRQLLEVGTITYSDTDIMSQATYQLYNATDKYFNISQFFGFENLWDYMLLNWFGGNVTIYLRIFWQLLTYWLVVSIAWLIFDLFMYVPKLAHRWLDRSALE